MALCPGRSVCALAAAAVMCAGMPEAGALDTFEARHTHPLDITPDGTRLLAVNSVEGRLSVFVTGEGTVAEPLLISEIPVGLEPVSVRAAPGNTAWVVNEVHDSVSVVDLERRSVIRTIHVPDEPADVVFAGTRAFVSCARSNEIAVIDRQTLTETTRIPLQGLYPRALAVSPDGSRLYAAMLLSGNNTTVLPFRKAPPQPAPTNPALPTPPQTALVLPDSDPRVTTDVLDHDIVEIDTATLQITRWLEGAGTNITALTALSDGTLWAAALEAGNTVRFEPALRGTFSESRLVRFAAESAVPQITNLNPGAVAAVVSDAAKVLALSQPMALLADGNQIWTAAFASDRIALLDSSGNILRRIDLWTAGTEVTMRGPRGMVKHERLHRLFVLNKLSNSISVVSTSDGTVLGEVPLSSHDPVPPDVRAGRAAFYDARRSGNGTVSCSSCHLDADVDGIAWDLGDPGGPMQSLTGYSLSLGETQPVERAVHPMKGPMVTQPLRGLRGTGPFHWRGDKARLQDFGGSFASLLAGRIPDTQEADQLAAWLESLRSHPNPNRNPDNSLRSSVAGGNPVRGKSYFEQNQTCSKCHPGERGSNYVLDEFTSVLTVQPVKNATLEHAYKKTFFTPHASVTLSGYGFTHDGTGHLLPRGHEYDQDRFRLYPGAEADVAAYVLSAGTDTPPAAAQSLTIQYPGASISADPPPQEFVLLMEAQARAAHCDFIIQGNLEGRCCSFLFEPQSGLYAGDTDSRAPLSVEEIASRMLPGDSLTFLGVPFGSGRRLSIDRDSDGVRNADEPAPVPILLAPPVRLSLPLPPGWYAESSGDLSTWTPAALPPSGELPGHTGRLFIRLSRTW